MQLGKVLVDLMPHHKRVPILEQETYDPHSDVLFIKISAREPVHQYYSEGAFAVFCTQRAKALVGLKVYGLKSDVLNAIQTRLRQYFDEYLRRQFEGPSANEAFEEKLRQFAQFDLESRKADFFIQEVGRASNKIAPQRALSASAS